MLQASLVALCVAIVAGCAGKDGSDGAVGPAGADGADANANCVQCHADDETIVAKQHAWSTSMHATGTSFDYAGSRGYCDPCHSGNAYTQQVTNGSVASDAKYNVTPVNCRTCHQIHVNGDSTDWALTNEAAFTLIADPSGSVDYGKGNLCATGHQLRRHPSLDSDGLPVS